ncbi:MAG TPA: IS21 family transposase [Gemmatimonadaceae bacterium]|nr:IS21 family transposase [Gemmatimonadaceae bacterium]
MRELHEGKTLERAALKSAMSENTARRYREGAPAKGARPQRTYRTRPDPFEAVWPEVEKMLEAAPGLESKTIFGLLLERPENAFTEGQLRTLQRKIRQWRAAHGPHKEVMFPQKHRPGEYGQSDFTSMNDLRITIDGEEFDHLVYHFVLPYSQWETGMVCFSESFETLIAGFQQAVGELGRVPHRHRTDNLSAATHDLRDGRRAFNERYLGAMAHYGVEADRNTPGRAHENGSVEQAHYRFKCAVEQALLVRGRRDFADRASYESFLREIFAARNKRRTNLGDDLRGMKELPPMRIEDFRRERVSVTRFSTIRAADNTYSVSSRLIGQDVDLRLYAETVEVWHGQRLMATMERQRGRGNVAIDYRHVIWSLVRKPGAFARYRYREALFPTLTFRRAYDALVERLGSAADVEYVRILHLAASTSETAVDAALMDLLTRGELRDYAQIRAAAVPEPVEVPTCAIEPPDLSAYDAITAAGGEG